ncbi:FkbM family methyltransferase [Pendulispora brunnea]|uniref:FkbM family methyltransferase n=1 Tax=Pendulispora brunnea TaxID=2905690 RepID=A0ABZ2KIS3_9BACT
MNLERRVISAARSVLPTPVWGRLRSLRRQLHVLLFRPRVVRHRYGRVDLRVQLADGMGTGWYDHDWELLPEIELLSRHKLRPGARVFDLGAHQAVVAMMLAHEVGEKGSVIAVEATKHNVAVANKNRELNGVRQLTVVYAAVSDKPGKLVMGPGLNGQVDDGSGQWGREEVEAVPVDELARRYGNPDVLFIDIEGFECQALRGAKEALARKPDCFIEVHVGAGLEKFGSLDELLSFFPTSDYELLMRQEEDKAFRPFDRTSSVVEDRFFLVALAR